MLPVMAFVADDISLSAQHATAPRDQVETQYRYEHHHRRESHSARCAEARLRNGGCALRRAMMRFAQQQYPPCFVVIAPR